MDEPKLDMARGLGLPKPTLWQWAKTSKGRWTLLAGVTLTAVLAATAVTYARFAQDQKSGTPKSGAALSIDFGAKKNQVQLVPADLDGTLVAPDHAKRRPLAVMVENHLEARPQSGINNASLVFEVITEGGITRFMAIFGPRDAAKIGPIRSARPYFVQFASGWNALYTHAGGSEAGLAAIATAPVADLNDTVGYFHREPRPGIASEHTLFSSTDELYRLAKDRKASLDPQFTPWKFEDDPATGDRPSSQTASVDFSSPEFKVDWAYDAASDTYRRSLASQPHRDAQTGDQLTSKNVAILTVTRQLNAAANHGKGEWTMQTIESGQLRLLKHGRLTEGTWKKESLAGMLRFFDSDGNELSLGRGQTWIEVVPPDSTVSVN